MAEAQEGGAGMGPKVIEAKDIFKTYGEGPRAVEVLKGLNFTVDAGEYLMILGPSGSGKSTLLNILGLMDRPHAGEVLICGEPVSRLDETERSLMRNARIGFVFQFDSLLPEFTVLENVTMPARIAGLSLDAAAGRANELLRGLGLADLGRRFPNELSGGERQRVAICRALLKKPSILLADEPTGNLDRPNGELVFGDLKGLAKREGAAVVVVTHNEAACRHSDRVLRVADGRITDGA